ELAHGLNYQSRQHGGAINLVQPVQGAAEAVILQPADLVGSQADVFRDVPGEPFGQGIQWAARQQQVGNQDTEGDGGRDLFGMPGGWRQVACQERLELEALQEAAYDGSGADFERFKRGTVQGGSHWCLSAFDVGREG